MTDQATATVEVPGEQFIPMGWLELGEYQPPSGRRIRVRAPVMFTLMLEDVEDPTRQDVSLPCPDRGWVLEQLMPQLAERLKIQITAMADAFRVSWPPEGTSVAAALGDSPGLR
jgi:hypothetical protein